MSYDSYFAIFVSGMWAGWNTGLWFALATFTFSFCVRWAHEWW